MSHSNSTSVSSRDPVLAFGVEPAKRKYRLRLSRYYEQAAAVERYVKRRDAENSGAASEPLRFLDIGMDEGRSLKWLEARGIDHRLELHGIDISAAHLEDVYQKNRWTLRQADAQKTLPYPDRHFDIVVCEQVLEHLENPGGAAAEIGRVLKPGGIAIVGVPGFPPGTSAISHRFMSLWRRVSRKTHAHIQYFTTGTLKRLLREQGGLRIELVNGPRFVSGGLIAPLEDYAWFWRLNCWIGRRIPSLCQDIQVTARKP